ncbi:MAG: oligosaccharide flippase family protein, partial [Burkholderiales bacterium]|nr:oligosaccharide flippase family protein [Burkholderiales bacterium]
MNSGKSGSMMARKSSSLVSQVAMYASSNVLVLAAGLLSFPITTRLLSSEQFGLLTFWESGMLVIIAILKLGCSDGVMRFYPHSHDPLDSRRYVTNIVLPPIVLGIGGWLICMVAASILAYCGYLDHPLLLFLALGQVLPQVWGPFAFRILQARELAAINSTLSVIWRWATVGAVLSTLFWLTKSAVGVLGAKLLVHWLVVGGLVIWLLPSLPFSTQAYDRQQVVAGLSYGLPLALMEISNIALWYLDRLMMKWLLNDYAVIGIYGIGFALASYLDQLLTSAIAQSLTPVAIRLYATEGAAAVRALKRRVLRPITYLIFAVGTGLIAGGTDFLTMLASADKVGAVPVFKWVGIFFLVRAWLNVASEGLLLEKRSRVVFVLTLLAALINALANVILIPLIGMMGAVYATGISMIGLQLLFFVYCPRDLKALPDAVVVLRALGGCLLSLTLVWSTGLFGLENHLVRFLVAGLFIALVFGM